MPAPVVVEFLVRSMPAVQNAFRTVEQAAVASERSQTTARARGAQQRASTTDREARDKIRLMLKTDAEVKRIYDREVRAAAMAAKQKVSAEVRAEREMIRAADRSANEKMRIARHVDREYAAMQKRRSVDDARIIREDDRRQEQAAKNRQRIRERSASMAGRYATQEAKREGGDRTRFAQAAYGHISGGVSAGVHKVTRGVSYTAGLLGQLGGGFSVADSVMSESKLRKQAAVLSANTILSGAGTKGADASLGKAMSTDDILGKAKAIGVQQNIDPSDILKGFDEIKKLTGNVEKATQVMPGIAKLATATGGDVAEMSGMAANILAANPNLSNEDLQKQMRIFTKQGVVGGVEVADFAKYGSRITAAATAYGTDPSKGITKESNEATLGAMAQMSRQYGSAGTAAEASLSSLRFTTDIAKHSESLKSGLGIDISDGKGGLKNMQDILIDMVKKTQGDITKFNKTGLGERGVKPLEGVSAIYKQAGGGQKGIDAIVAEFKKYTTGVTEAEIDAANKRVLAEQEVEIQMKKLQIAVGEQLLPELVKLAPVLREAMPMIAQLLRGFTQIANWAASHPFAAVGAVMAAEVTKSIALAGIGELIKRLLGGGAVPPPGGGAGAGLGGAAAAGAAAGIATGAVIYNAGTKYADGTFKADDMAAKVRSYGQGNRASGIAPEAAMEEVERAKGRLDKNGGMFNQAGNIISSPFSDQASKDYGQFKADQALVDNKELIAAIKEVTIAVKQGGGGGNGGGQGGAAPAAATTGIVQRTK